MNDSAKKQKQSKTYTVSPCMTAIFFVALENNNKKKKSF